MVTDRKPEPVPEWSDIIAAKDAEIVRMRGELQTWINHTKLAVWSDSEECKLLKADNERLRAEVKLIVEERDRTFALMLARAEGGEAEIEQNRIDLEEYRRDVERLRKALTDIYYTTREDKTAAKARAALEHPNDA